MSALYTSHLRSVPVREPYELTTSLHRNRRWLQVMSHIGPQYGGIATSVPRLAKATELSGSYSCPILGFCESDELECVPKEQQEGITLFTSKRTRWMVDVKLKQKLKNIVSEATGLHIHGIWEPHCLLASEVARECRRPYLLSAHGMLEPWALRNKRIKKAFYAALFEMRTLRRAACLRALSSDEVEDYRRVGLTNPIAIIPNATEIHPAIAPDLFLQQFPELAGKRILLFMGRIHQKKGLPMLLRAWSRVAANTPDARLVIAGPDSDNLQESLQRLTGELQLQSSVVFTGMLTGDLKWSALSAAGGFVLPSYSEGFSVAVLEALSFGLPAIVTTPCHIPEIAKHSCGWVINPEVEPLAQVLSEFLSFSSEETELMGKRGQDLVRTRFYSPVVGEQLAQVYNWLQGGDKPGNVEIV